MPVFKSIEEAKNYILEQNEKGLTCEQRFDVNGIYVFCYLNAGIEREYEQPKRNVRVLPASNTSNVKPLNYFSEPNEIKNNPIKPIPEKVIKQEVFPQNKTLELPHELRDYQREAVAFAIAHKHCIIELPTGRGKTLTSLAIVNEIIKERPRRTLVLVPTTVLLDQWINDGFKASGIEASGVGNGMKQWGEYTVSTYQSAIRNLQHIPQYEIVIFDEVHHLFSPEYSKILTTLLNSPNGNMKYLIGLTATVREYGDAKIMQDQYFPNVFSKRIEDFQTGATKIPVRIERMPVSFNEEEMEYYKMYQETIRKANRSLGPMPTWREYAHSSDEPTRRLALAAMRDYAAEKKLLTETPEKISMILEILENNPGQFIIFSDTIDGITAIENALRENGITVGSIYSKISAVRRQQIIQGLKNRTIRVLVGGNAISEGLDLPDISNVILSSMLVSSIRTPVQRLGRVLRPSPGKHVKIFLVYVKDTMEETNAMRIYDILGEERDI